MDPLTAFVNLATELVKLFREVAQGQPPEVKAELWRMYLDDVKWWRKALKIDEPK